MSEKNPLTELVRPHVEDIKASPAGDNLKAKAIIDLYRLHCSCPSDPGAVWAMRGCILDGPHGATGRREDYIDLMAGVPHISCRLAAAHKSAAMGQVLTLRPAASARVMHRTNRQWIYQGVNRGRPRAAP